MVYESTPLCFAESADLFSTSTPLTYATIYRNDVWKDHLVVAANMNAEVKETTLAIRSPGRLGFQQDCRYVLFEIKARKATPIERIRLRERGIGGVRVPAKRLTLLYLRQPPHDGPFHLWGGKRISEAWDAASKTRSLEPHGPMGLEDDMLIGTDGWRVKEVKVDGQQAHFRFDPAQQMVHGWATLGSSPIRVDVRCSAANRKVD